MSWKTSGRLLNAPPTSSNSNKLDPRFRPNLGGLNAFQREQQLVSHYGVDREKEVRRSEWDVLKDHHRDDEQVGEVSWEERLARAYESKLFKEFALIDLKHYKSRKLALRWRTAEEVVDGIGEETCASLRCKYHLHPSNPPSIQWDPSTPIPSSSRKRKKTPPLRSFELPFVYVEADQRKEALVKVRLCRRCQGKLTWKPGQNPDQDDSGDDDQDESGLRERDRGTSERRRREHRRHERDKQETSDDYSRRKSDSRRREKEDGQGDDRNRDREVDHAKRSGRRDLTPPDEDGRRSERPERRDRRERSRSRSPQSRRNIV